MNVSSGYAQAWERFWQDAPDGPGGAFWDVAPALAAQRHLAYFEAHFDPGLPVVDLGCGSGTQTRFLAGRYPRVLGVDLAHAAVARARRDDPRGLAGYQRLDAVDTDAVRALHAEVGDANVYLRGILHLCEPGDRSRLVDGVATLTGQRGRAFAVEWAEAAGDVLRDLARGPDGPRPELAAVLAYGVAPGGLRDDAVPGYFTSAGLDVLAAGQERQHAAGLRPDGARTEVPSHWLVAGLAA
ncbi:class I SAM-dependent methyltransferase [Streptomyces sp. NBC_01198]|uniref:class I SAM-dependent methyltransferase n=1 Tax=Streptomyces sp. NBC_01198 TaxID=2903769 RepID=UPI002E1585B3|nr:class I SAM-dependent methyltransferase [Streptomyces sp. NBC_01198]